MTAKAKDKEEAVFMMPQARWGTAEDSLSEDWRSAPDDPDPDDEDVETPEYLIEMLGFDPGEDDEDEEKESPKKKKAEDDKFSDKLIRLMEKDGITFDAEFKESDHPRDPKGTTTGGQFTSNPSSATVLSGAAIKYAKQLKLNTGSVRYKAFVKLFEHLENWVEAKHLSEAVFGNANAAGTLGAINYLKKRVTESHIGLQLKSKKFGGKVLFGLFSDVAPAPSVAPPKDDTIYMGGFEIKKPYPTSTQYGVWKGMTWHGTFSTLEGAKGYVTEYENKTTIEQPKLTVSPAPITPTVAAAPVSIAPVVPPKSDIEELKAVYEFTKSKGYTHETSPVPGIVLMKTAGGGEININDKGEWTSSSPGKSVKAGKGKEALEALLSGKFSEAQAKGVSTGYTSLIEKSGYKAPPPPLTPAQIAEKTKLSKRKLRADKIKDKMNEVEKTADKLREKLAEVRPTPTAAESDAIGAYKGSGYGSINNKLRTTTDRSPKAELVRGWLAKASIPEDTILYRGVGGSAAETYLGSLFQGTEYHDLGFGSTSTSMAFANSWAGRSSDGTSGGILFQIKVPKGTQAATIRALGSHDGEKEVLLQSGMRFRVVHMDTATRFAKVEVIGQSDDLNEDELTSVDLW